MLLTGYVPHFLHYFRGSLEWNLFWQRREFLAGFVFGWVADCLLRDDFLNPFLFPEPFFFFKLFLTSGQIHIIVSQLGFEISSLLQPFPPSPSPSFNRSIQFFEFSFCCSLCRQFVYFIHSLSFSFFWVFSFTWMFTFLSLWNLKKRFLWSLRLDSFGHTIYPSLPPSFSPVTLYLLQVLLVC